jgi:alkaline phosphatase
MSLRPLLAAGALLAGTTLLATSALATTIYPIDRATILSGQTFDFKVEFDGVVAPGDISVMVNGVDHAEFFGRDADFIEREEGVDASAVRLHDLRLTTPGKYVVTASDGANETSVTWEVYGTDRQRSAKNVILMIGDGMSLGHRSAARLLSKGMEEGRFGGPLAMDRMPHMALLGSGSIESIITDSANSASAYTTGHKSNVNALGVYGDRTPDVFDDPKVETIGQLVKRRLNMAVGVVTDAEVQDATPASVVANTRRRAEKAAITEMFHDVEVDVLMGGGSAYFLPQSVGGSKRQDERNFIEAFQQRGHQLVTTESEMLAAAADASTTHLLGLFHPENMDGVLDRKFLRPAYMEEFPEQPDLVDMTRAALDVLSRHEDGFFLMVEAALIDKYSHPLDWERAVMDTIMFDQAVAAAKQFAAVDNDTLLIVVPDHTHGISVVGTIDDNIEAADMRDKIGVYDEAGYPDYQDTDGDGYPDTLDVAKRLYVTIGNFPDHYDTFRPKLEGRYVPAVRDDAGNYVANEAYQDVPGAVFREGNLPRSASTGVHTLDDVVVTATGPGADKFSGFMENTEVFRVIANALALGE